jgi:hypothetical protein
MNRRKEALEALIRYDNASPKLFEQLRVFPVDWDGPPLAILTVRNVIPVLDAFLAGNIDAEQLTAWGNGLEGRDDLDYDPAHETKLKDVIFRIATPEIKVALSVEYVTQMRTELNESLG